MNAYFCKYILPLYTFPLWRFQWSCQVASSGAGCLVYSGASRAPQRLEEALDTGTLARSARALTTCIRHVLPSRTLVPGTYVFTVTVSKGNLSSEASMKMGLGQTLSSSSSHTNVTQVEIITGNPPTISPIALQRRYNPDQGITVNGESGILSEDNRQSVQIQFIVQCALAQCSVCLYDDEKGFLLSWT